MRPTFESGIFERLDALEGRVRRVVASTKDGNVKALLTRANDLASEVHSWLGVEPDQDKRLHALTHELDFALAELRHRQRLEMEARSGNF